MRLRGAIKQLDFQSCSGTVIPNSTSLEYDEECEIGFLFNDLSLPLAAGHYLIPGLQVFFSVVQDAYGGVGAFNVVPAFTGRYRARCVLNGSHKVFIPDLQIAAEVNEASAFELGGADHFQRNDEILVVLTWEEVIQAQMEQRMPEVTACGTLTARGHPFLTDGKRMILNETAGWDRQDCARRPFEKLERASTPTECCGPLSRGRSKSFDGMPSPMCFGYLNHNDTGYSRTDFDFLGIRGSRMQAMTPTSFDPFYNHFIHASNSRASRSDCHSFRF